MVIRDNLVNGLHEVSVCLRDLVSEVEGGQDVDLHSFRVVIEEAKKALHALSVELAADALDVRTDFDPDSTCMCEKKQLLRNCHDCLAQAVNLELG